MAINSYFIYSKFENKIFLTLYNISNTGKIPICFIKISSLKLLFHYALKTLFTQRHTKNF
ncbi:hypothetical protein VF14_23340 [Nostoc linckia z18]|uniref:Uncharacterized protein n=2 Tax=Nostoc linckia TaxID=92942 RepID=A0A9Q5Z778_NOSLI|nr:hypothetical protein VF02_06815 [Nostoc linckia z1]PHJ67741.1 hypothetical protein VF05_17140 [Nostoc linckia z3]PHJ77273.1 hypothetical protein VF03_05375 [Nostoc linckia z2]PHJ78151.1 hypothetical protein VF06_28690 [Nostoc linckia z4]PHJ87452.1 hypothetical protein VF07_20655 [Nostoc linckia z6]PHJ90856.1 hypothetical protein VF04_30430 [Nostoc linckia z7]PHJ97365.1 hypothetical protein VF08_28885 [Nostoc linckia z8]PHK05639.1 hypothetical protein VF09_26605 [Nostoc linckia z9]PHK1429